MLTRFLQSLLDHGRAELAAENLDLKIAISEAAGEKQAAAVTRMLASWHQSAVLDLPGPALAFHSGSGLWGAVLLFRAACLVAYRDFEKEDITRWLLSQEMPDVHDPAAHFSADLCLRHWASLYRMARALSEDDPLVKTMELIAHRRPLALPGMHLGADASHALFCHAGLAQLFAERALERSDTSCLALPSIHSLVRSKLGNYSAELGRGLLITEISS